jgi:hypothetical protein
MNIFQFKINRKIDEFSVSLAEEYISASSLEEGKSSKKYYKKLDRADNALNSKIENFKKENKLGIYRKARIGNKFMWFLLEHGVEKELAEDITKKILLKLNEKN